MFGVLNATRRPGTAAFTQDDLEYLTRFAGQLSIAVANSMAFAAERERSEQLALVNALLREISGTLSRERILETAVRRIQEAFQHPVVAISVPDHEGGTYSIVAMASRERVARRRAELPPLLGRDRAGLPRQAHRPRRPTSPRDPDYIALVPSTRSEVAIPILSGDDVAAVLNVEKDEPGRVRPRAGHHAGDPRRRHRRGAAQRRAVPGPRDHQRQARRAGPDEERAGQHRGPRLPGPPGRRARPRRAPGVAARRAAGGPHRGGALDHPRRDPHGEPGGQDARRPRASSPAGCPSSSRSSTSRR